MTNTFRGIVLSDEWQQPARAARAEAIFNEGDVYSDSLDGLMDRLRSLKSQVDAFCAAAGCAPLHTGSLQRAIDDLARRPTAGEIETRENAWVLLNELFRIAVSVDPARCDLAWPVQPSRAQIRWGTPFPRPPSAEERGRRAAANAQQHAADHRRHRMNDAKNVLSHFAQGRGVMFRVERETLVAWPAAWLTDDDRRQLAEYAVEICAILADEVRFGPAKDTLAKGPARSRPKSAGEPRASAA